MTLPKGVIFNAYPDSIGIKLNDTVDMLKRSEFKDVFSLFYILPTVFNSDLDRGFSIIDYDLNEELVSEEDLDELKALNIKFKFDLVLNHLSVGSPQFQDMLKNGDDSKYKDFFINWNEFWESNGEMGPDGNMIPNKELLDMLFMRKPGLPILQVRFPDGSYKPYWNTFYQEINYPILSADDLRKAIGPNTINEAEVEKVTHIVNEEVGAKKDVNSIELGGYEQLKEDIVSYLEQNRTYLGQMDLNAQSELVWDFYDETLRKLRDHGGKLIRMDAFAYLHKEPGQINFFNEPGTWEYLERLRSIATKYELILLPEIHSVYGSKLHEKVSSQDFPIYDFFLPGLLIHALDKGTNHYILKWIKEILDKNINTINMLGCHDGIPVLDLKGEDKNGVIVPGMLSDSELDEVVEKVMDHGGRVKNLYGPDGKKIAYYQVNATYFSALGEDEQKMRLARAIQIFMPGIPQVWYLDIFVGKNDYAAADRGGTGGHKEINRANLSMQEIKEGLKKPVVLDQLEMLRLRNKSIAFDGSLRVRDTDINKLELTWENKGFTASLIADLKSYKFSIEHKDADGNKEILEFN
ncbi:MAG: glycosidase [Bacteroidota bacterium]